jgi:hypothetical protein
MFWAAGKSQTTVAFPGEEYDNIDTACYPAFFILPD